MKISASTHTNLNTERKQRLKHVIQLMPVISIVFDGFHLARLYVRIFQTKKGEPAKIVAIKMHIRKY